MQRGLLIATSFLALLGWTGLAGCGGEDGPPSGPATPVPVAHPPAVPGGAGGASTTPGAPLDPEWWGRRPAVRILLTGGQRGKLKPCGCSSPQLGGTLRMAAVLHQLRARADASGGAVAALALGGSLRGSGEEQEEAKATYLRAVREALGFSAALLGEGDLRVPAMCQPRGEGAERPRPPLNVRLAALNPATETPPFADFEVGGVAVRALGVLDPTRAEALQADGQVEGVMSVSHAFEGLQPRPGSLWIVAGRFPDARAAEVVRAGLARLGPGVVVDLSEGGAAAARRLDGVPLVAGAEPLLVELGELGKAVGVLDLDPAAQGGGWTASYRRLELVPQWEKYGYDTARRVEALDELYREMVHERGYLEDFPRRPPEAARYVGSSACARCHGAIYNDWRRTRHADALDTLRGVGYDWDPECVRCHVVGWERDRSDPDAWHVAADGFRTPPRTPYLGGVGCESCHGPGSLHAADPTSRAPFAAGGPNRAQPDARTTCVACHDAENSHGFLEGYADECLPRVDHRSVPSDLRSVLPADWRPAGK